MEAKNPSILVKVIATGTGVRVDIYRNGKRQPNIILKTGTRATEEQAAILGQVAYEASPVSVDNESKVARFINHLASDILRPFAPSGHLWQAKHIAFTPMQSDTEGQRQALIGQISKLQEQLAALG